MGVWFAWWLLVLVVWLDAWCSLMSVLILFIIVWVSIVGGYVGIWLHLAGLWGGFWLTIGLLANYCFCGYLICCGFLFLLVECDSDGGVFVIVLC